MGLTVLDNIDVNGRLIRSGNGIADGNKGDSDDDHKGGDGK